MSEHKRRTLSLTAVVITVCFVLGAAFWGYMGYIWYTDSVEATQSQENEPTVEAITPYTLYNATNEQRKLASVGALALRQELNDSATDKCNDMVARNYYGHKNPTTGKQGYTYVFDHLKTNGGYASENLNDGNGTNTQDFIDSWLGSPAHKAAMLDPKYTDVGFAVCHIPNEPADNRTLVMHLAEVKP